MNSANLRKIKSGFIKTIDRHQAGLACVASVINYFGGSVEMQQLHESSGAAKNGVSLLGLCKAAQNEGFTANGFKGNIDAIKGLKDPVILHVSKDSGGEDFIVLYGWYKNRFIVGDPQWGIIEYREDEMNEIWKSNSLILMEPNESFQTINIKRKLKREWLINLLGEYKRVIATTGIFGMVSAVVLVVLILFFFEKSTTLFGNTHFVIESVFLFTIFLILILVLHFKNVFILQGAKNLTLDLIAQITENIFNRDIGQKDSSSANINMLEKAVDRFSKFVFKVTAHLPFYIVLFIVSLVFISIISIWAGIVIVLGAAIILLVIRINNTKIKQLYVSENEDVTERAKLLNYNSRIFQNIKLINGEKSFISKNVDNLRIILETKLSKALFKDQQNNWLFLGFALVAIILIKVTFDLGEGRSQASLISALGWFTVSFLSLYKLTKLYIDFNSAKIFYTIIYNRVGVKQINNKDGVRKDDNREITRIENLSVDNLAFGFPGQAPIFQDVNFVAEIGHITVVNGATGSGKSILVSILSRIRPLQSGEVRINDFAWDNISDFDWRMHASAVLQPVQLFDNNVLKNIGAGIKTIEPKKIISFCKEMEFHKFIKELPNGYSTSINNLSAGQKQLISLAMALYRKPKILLLDEPFAHMDETLTSFYIQLLHKLKNEMIIVVFTCNDVAKSKDSHFFVHKLGNYI